MPACNRTLESGDIQVYRLMVVMQRHIERKNYRQLIVFLDTLEYIEARIVIVYTKRYERKKKETGSGKPDLHVRLSFPPAVRSSGEVAHLNPLARTNRMV